MAAIQYSTLEEEPVRSAVVIPFPGVTARPAKAGRAPGAGRPGGVPPVAVLSVGGGRGASGSCGLGGTLSAVPTATRLPESVYRRRRLVAASVLAAVLTVLLAVARPAEAPLEAVDPWSSPVTGLTGIGYGVQSGAAGAAGAAEFWPT